MITTTIIIAVLSYIVIGTVLLIDIKIYGRIIGEVQEPFMIPSVEEHMARERIVKEHSSLHNVA